MWPSSNWTSELVAFFEYILVYKVLHVQRLDTGNENTDVYKHGIGSWHPGPRTVYSESRLRHVAPGFARSPSLEPIFL